MLLPLPQSSPRYSLLTWESLLPQLQHSHRPRHWFVQLLSLQGAVKASINSPARAFLSFPWACLCKTFVQRSLSRTSQDRIIHLLNVEIRSSLAPENKTSAKPNEPVMLPAQISSTSLEQELQMKQLDNRDSSLFNSIAYLVLT